MVGYLHFTGRDGRVRLVRHQIRGMTVLEGSLPGKGTGLFAARRVAKALRLLEDGGCRRLLSPCPQAPHLPAVHTRSLWQAVAAPLALTELERQGTESRRAVVALHADRASRSFLRTCQLLSRKVKALSISLEQPDRAEWLLQQELGIPLVQGCGDVTVSFLPGVCRPGYFSLGSPDPVIPGYQIRLEGLILPEGCPELPLLAALLDSGRLPLSALQVIPTETEKQPSREEGLSETHIPFS